MSLYNRVLKISREKNASSSQRFLDLVLACNAFSDTTRLPYIFDGISYTEYKSPAILAQTLAGAKKAWEEGKDVILATHKGDSIFSLTHSDIFDDTEQDDAEFAFNLRKPLLGPDGYFSFDTFFNFFKTTIQAYDGKIARVYDSELELLIQGLDVNGRPAPLNPINNLMTPGTFDILKIPEAVYWFNYWNKEQVQLIGEEKLNKAPFEVIEKQSDGGYILITQKENFSARTEEHIKKLSAICAYLDLYTLQESYES
ncbi:hypothetical protein [Chitinophaga sp.]|uniref:hypothetical protein n=1 Tax=Chitinophaga sp. TaxID=1869181 RepID=UPI0031DBFB6B